MDLQNQTHTWLTWLMWLSTQQLLLARAIPVTMLTNIYIINGIKYFAFFRSSSRFLFEDEIETASKYHKHCKCQRTSRTKKKNQECCVRQASQIKAINYFQLRYGCLIQMNTIRNDIFRKWENNGRINRNGICHAANESMLKQTAPVLTRFACKSVGLTETEPEHSPWAFFRNIRI